MKEKISRDLKAAMKNKDTFTTSTLRMILAQLQLKEKEKGIPVNDETAVQVLYTMIRKREEAAEQFRKGGREDLAEKESRESAIIKSYLPQQLTEEEIRQEVLSVIAEFGSTSVKELGKIMGALMKKLSGRAQGGIISRIAREELQKIESSKNEVVP